MVKFFLKEEVSSVSSILACCMSDQIFTTKDKLTSPKRGARLAKPRAAEFVKNYPLFRYSKLNCIVHKGCFWVPVSVDCLKPTVIFAIPFQEAGTVKIIDFNYSVNTDGLQEKISSCMGLFQIKWLYFIRIMLHRTTEFNFHCPITKTRTLGSKSEDHSSLVRWKYLWELSFYLHTSIPRYRQF